MSDLYPLKFVPVFQERIWGGSRLKTALNKNTLGLEQIGESWELSGVEDNVSEIANGFLAGNDLHELIEIYMGDLVGEKVYDKFGIEFPLLIKFIDAEDDLSIQVHPNDELSKMRHNAYGKTEMWYVIDAEPGAKLNLGFNQPVDRQKYIESVENGRLNDILNFESVAAGDVFFIPSGRVHAIGKGILVAEIQQTSDITYRIFDYNRTDAEGKPRELHTDLALDAIDFSYHNEYKTIYQVVKNQTTEIVNCPFFTTNILEFEQPVAKDFAHLDSFVIYICTEGAFTISYDGGEENVERGETVLIPASIDEFVLTPVNGNAKTLEVYID